MTHSWGRYLHHRRNWMRGQRAPGARPARNTGGGPGAGPRGMPGGGSRLPALAAGGDAAKRPAGPGLDTGRGPMVAMQDWWDSTVVSTNRWCARLPPSCIVQMSSVPSLCGNAVNANPAKL